MEERLDGCYPHEFQVVKMSTQHLGSGYIKLTTTTEKMVCVKCGRVVDPFVEE